MSIGFFMNINEHVSAYLDKMNLCIAPICLLVVDYNNLKLGDDVVDKYCWEYNGTLKEIDSTNNMGVYLLIYNGTPKRIIYLGTTNSFNRRLYEHQEGMLTGKRAVWRTSTDKDIYELMSFEGFSENGKYKYYAKLSKNNLLWAATNLEKDFIENDLNNRDNYELNWKDYVCNKYIDNIEIWTCKIQESQERIIQLESQIQRAFKNNYKIGSHIHKNGMCWLGKIELLGNIYNYHYEFSTYPDLDNDSTKLLRNLTDKSIIKYKKKRSIDKKVQQTELIIKNREKYTMYGKSWISKEDDILYTLSKDGVPIEEMAEKYLLRAPEEITRRIKYLSKYYDFSIKNE